MYENVFHIAPEPRYLYLTDSLRATLDKVRYVIDFRGGLTVIYGDVGLGKSSVLKYLYEEYSAREDVVTGYLPTPQYKTDTALMRAICAEFGLPVRRSMLDQESDLRGYLAEQLGEGRNAVVFVDEAQIIQGRVLELFRLLLNLQTDRSLMQIVLAGQLELRDRLRDPTKRALRSRIFITSTLDPLTLKEARGMVDHRCALDEAPLPFLSETVEQIWKTAKGVPREIVKRCGLALHIARQNGLDEVPPEALEAVDSDIPRVDVDEPEMESV